MKKTTKYATLLLAAITLNATILPTVASVCAETTSQTTTSNKLSESQVNDLVDEVAENHPDVSKEWIKEVAERQLQGDYSLPPTEGTMFRSAWQGITVGQAAAAIDVGLGIALGGAAGGLANAIKSRGKHAAKSALKNVLAGIIGGKVAESVLDYALNLTSPGTYIARWWDSQDRYPNNGRINF